MSREGSHPSKLRARAAGWIKGQDCAQHQQVVLGPSAVYVHALLSLEMMPLPAAACSRFRPSRYARVSLDSESFLVLVFFMGRLSLGLPGTSRPALVV